MKVKLNLNLNAFTKKEQIANFKALEWLNEHGYDVQSGLTIEGHRYAVCDIRIKDLKILVKEIGVCPEVYC